jgi:hypothetical protein
MSYNIIGANNIINGDNIISELNIDELQRMITGYNIHGWSFRPATTYDAYVEELKGIIDKLQRMITEYGIHEWSFRLVQPERDWKESHYSAYVDFRGPHINWTVCIGSNGYYTRPQIDSIEVIPSGEQLFCKVARLASHVNNSERHEFFKRQASKVGESLDPSIAVARKKLIQEATTIIDEPGFELAFEAWFKKAIDPIIQSKLTGMTKFPRDVLQTIIDEMYVREVDEL